MIAHKLYDFLVHLGIMAVLHAKALERLDELEELKSRMSVLESARAERVKGAVALAERGLYLLSELESMRGRLDSNQEECTRVIESCLNTRPTLVKWLSHPTDLPSQLHALGKLLSVLGNSLSF